MVIALLVLLGVELAVIVALAILIVGRRRFIKRHPGAFDGAIRTTEREEQRWRRGSGWWAGDVLVWHGGPLLYRTSMFSLDTLPCSRQAEAGELRWLGDEPFVAVFLCGTTTIEVGSRGLQSALAAGPHFSSVPRSSSPEHQAGGAL